MDDEFKALMRNNTWHLVPDLGQPKITCKWVFRVKRNTDGSVARYKARLVVRGFLQQPGRDYSETFSPVIKPVTVRIILSLALSANWSIRQLDINNAFLNGKLTEAVYMTQPQGFRDPTHPDYICKLDKALYGLKQAPRAWYLALSSFLLKFGFIRSVADSSLFYFCKDGLTLYFLVYVDDIIVTGNSAAFVATFIRKLADEFSLKDMGPLSHFLGVEVISTPTGLFLSQRSYLNDILTQLHMDGAKPVTTPMASNLKLRLTEGSLMTDAKLYRRTLGMLQYLSLT